MTKSYVFRVVGTNWDRTDAHGHQPVSTRVDAEVVFHDEDLTSIHDRHDGDRNRPVYLDRLAMFAATRVTGWSGSWRLAESSGPLRAAGDWRRYVINGTGVLVTITYQGEQDRATPAERLEQLRQALRDENISYGELAELQGLADQIDRDDVELLEAAGVPEFATYEVTVPVTVTVTGDRGRLVVTGVAFDGWGGFFSEAEEAMGVWDVDHETWGPDNDAAVAAIAREFIHRQVAQPGEEG